MRKVLTPQQGLAKVGLNVEQVVKRILRTFNKATAEQITAGLFWYVEANELVRYLAGASCYTEDQVAAAMAHLSPRLRWKQNVEAITELVLNDTIPNYVMSGPADRARKGLTAANPELTFGKKAKKTLNFSRNCSGCPQSVTIDVWAANVAGVAESELKLTGVYDAIAHCYRLAAKRVGITPAQMQAVTWIVVRGSAS
jgi:hypothetical protein